MPTVEQMMERYKELLETSKSYYENGHATLREYIERLATHYGYIRGYLSALYVYDFITDEKFHKLTDEILKIRLEYESIKFEKYPNE